MTDLECWDAFEREHPNTFGDMYQFWCQRGWNRRRRRIPDGGRGGSWAASGCVAVRQRSGGELRAASASKRDKTHTPPAFGAASNAAVLTQPVRISWWISGLSSLTLRSGRVIHSAVPFVQHRLGIQQTCLWEAPFFIACWFPFAKVIGRRRGASPSRPVRCLVCWFL